MNSATHFEAIVSEHYEALYRFALSLARTESDAQDLTQHTFQMWATKGHQLRDLARVKAWLFTTLHNAFLQARRRQDRFAERDAEEAMEQLPDASPDLSDRADSSEVLSALARVDETYQASVALFYLEDCAYKDIAAILGVPVGTVKSRIARGIAQLREILLSDDSRVSTPLNADLRLVGSLRRSDLAASGGETERCRAHLSSPIAPLERPPSAVAATEDGRADRSASGPYQVPGCMACPPNGALVPVRSWNPTALFESH